MPGELHKLWRAARPNGYHLEYGFSTMGYEIAGGLGVKMAHPDREVVVMLGDGSYMMMNSELATSVMLGRKLIVVVLDNRGFGCINRLQLATGGAQEYMAMEKLGQLHATAEADGRWDLIVVDTPPARSALDFLDAPEHLSTLLDGRFLRLLLAPTRGPLRLMSVGFTIVSAVMTKVLGAGIIRDVQTFVTAFEALFGGFRQRATDTFALLSSRHTTFLVVATPQRDTLREAAYFVDRLTEEQMPLSGLVLNRVHTGTLDVSAERALALAEDLDPRSVRGRDRGVTPPRQPDAADRGGDPADGPVQRLAPGRGPDAGSGVADGRDGPDHAASGRCPVGRQGLIAADRSRLRDQDCAPGGDVRVLAQQQPALPFGHPTPDAPLDAVVQSLGQALEADRAARAEQAGPLLVRGFRKQGILHAPALRAHGPVFVLQCGHAATPLGTNWSPYRAFPGPCGTALGNATKGCSELASVRSGIFSVS